MGIHGDFSTKQEWKEFIHKLPDNDVRMQSWARLSSLDKSNPIWTILIQFGQGLSNLNKSDPI